MAKKITFLLVVMFVLLIASVTAFAGTESTTPEAGFTEEKLEKDYNSVFFNDDISSDTKIITVKYERANNVETALRHTFTGSVEDTADMLDPVVMLMYIKADGKYVRLNDVVTGENVTEGLYFIDSTVDLKYLGSDKVNEVRVIAFRKSNAGKLQIDTNLQITDLEITVRPWNIIEKLKITFEEIKDDLTTP